MPSLGAVSRLEAILLDVVLVFLIAVSAWFIVLRFSIGWPLGAVFAVAIVSVVSFGALRAVGATERASSESYLFSCVIVTVAVAWVFWTYWAGVVLPGHDPIIVPTLADRIARGLLPIASYQPGDGAYTYPPGYPIAFIPIVLMLDKITALTVFKAMSLLTAALIPASWAWLLTRLFPISKSIWISLLLSYAVFFGLERTLLFGVAGKNSLYLMQLLAPPTILIMLRASERWRGGPIGALALFGLLLIHYSALHLVACIMAGCAMVDLVRRDLDIRRMLVLAMMGVTATAMLLLLYGEALVDPRHEGFRFGEIANALGIIAHALTAESNPLLVISHAVDVGLIRSPYRGPLLLASAAIALVAWWRLRTREAASIAAGASAFLAAIVAALAMAAELVPAGIKADFVRWFLWTIQAGLMFFGGLAVIALINASRARQILGGACALVVLFAVGFVSYRDRTQFRLANAWLAVHRSELQQLRTLLLKATDPERPCFLLGQHSGVGSFANEFVHQPFVLAYAEFLTPCTFANGGWLHQPVPDGRALEGYPSIAVMNGLLHQGSVLFVGAVAAQSAYATRLGSDFHWSSAGDFSSYHLWRIERGGQ